MTIAMALRNRGRDVRVPAIRSGPRASNYDVLVDGRRIEIKTAAPQISETLGVSWKFNIHRHAVLAEENVFGYVLRLEKFPGSKKALYMFMRAPIDRKTLEVSMRNILVNPRFYQAVQDWYLFAKGELQ